MRTTLHANPTSQATYRAARWVEDGKAACQREGLGARKNAEAVATATASSDDAAPGLRSSKMTPDEAQRAEHYGNGLQADLAQDAAGRSQGATWRKGTDALLQENLQWDLAGRLRKAVRTELPDHSQNFGPDNDGQLVEWKRGTANDQGTIATATQQQNWTLDNRGNWTQLQSTGAPTETRTYDAGNTLLTRGTQDISHDAGGYLTSDGQRTLTWSADGLLRTVTLSDARTVEYTYDGQKRLQLRTLRNAQGDIEERTQYTWSRWQLLEEATASQTRTYAYGEYIDDAVAVQVSGAGTYWYHRTLNYTTQALSNSTGNLIEAYAVQPYGTYRVILPGPDGQLGTADDTEQGHSSVGNGRVFQGLPIQDPLTGFVHARHRWYSPELGRWVSRDPIRFEAGDINLWRFVGNGPITSLDPMGLLTLREAYLLYYMGLGFPQTMNFSEVNYIKPIFSLFGGVSLPQKKSGSCCEERTVQISNATQATGTTGDQKLFLGNITLSISGSMKITSNCCWEFNGRVKALNDEFDFQASTHRPGWAEFLTTVGRVSGTLLMASTYTIEFIGDRPYTDRGCAK